jgi:hypothetical protein
VDAAALGDRGNQLRGRRKPSGGALMFIERILAIAAVLQPMAAYAEGASIVPIK